MWSDLICIIKLFSFYSVKLSLHQCGKTLCHSKLAYCVCLCVCVCVCVRACIVGRSVCVCKHANTQLYMCVCVCFLPVQHADKNKKPQTSSSRPLHLSLFPFRVKLPSNQLHKFKTTTCRAAAEAWQLRAGVGTVWNEELAPSCSIRLNFGVLKKFFVKCFMFFGNILV